jgi:hypothetical protein
MVKVYINTASKWIGTRFSPGFIEDIKEGQPLQYLCSIRHRWYNPASYWWDLWVSAEVDEHYYYKNHITHKADREKIETCYLAWSLLH